MDYQATYRAAAGTDVVVTNKPAILEKIIIGADVATSTIQISDHASSASGNVKLLINGSTLMTSTGGCVEVEAVFGKGITMTLTNQTQVTVIWKPIV